MPLSVCERFDELPDQEWLDIIKQASRAPGADKLSDFFRQKIFDHEYL